jgi:DNA-binding NarL/FixJ family response regulator
VSRNISIYIADDHPLFREGLRRVIEEQHGFHVVAQGARGDEALEYLQSNDVDVAVLDVDMPGCDGLDVIRRLQSERIERDVIFLTVYEDEAIFREALELGVRGYVLKESAATDILHAIRTVTEGKLYLSPKISRFLVPIRSGEGTPEEASPALLSTTEKTILRLIAQGKSTKEIAAKLHRSPKTIDNHRAKIASRLNLRGPHSVLRFALRYKNKL